MNYTCCYHARVFKIAVVLVILCTRLDYTHGILVNL